MLVTKEEEERALRAAVAATRPGRRRTATHGSDRRGLCRTPADGAPIAFSTLSPSTAATHALSLVRYSGRNRGKRRTQRAAVRRSFISGARRGGARRRLEAARRTLGDDDPFVKAALQGRPARDVAHEVIAGTRLLDLAARKALVDGGIAAIRASTDPLIALARRVDPIVRDVLDWRDNRIRSVEAAAGQQIASARFEVYGRSVYPDANFTLRLGYGRTLGYEEDSRLVPWKTTFFGLFDRAEGFGDKTPYDLTERWRTGRTALNLSTPLNFVYTGDTVGGNGQPGRQPARRDRPDQFRQQPAEAREPLRVHRRGRRRPRNRRP